MGWLTARKLKKLLARSAAQGLVAEAREIVARQGFLEYLATDPLYFGDVMGAYRGELDREAPIEGLEEVYRALSRKGGSQIVVHNFRHGRECWSLVTDGTLRIFYGAMVAREPIDISGRSDDSGKDGRYRETRKYGLKTFAPGGLAAFGRHLETIFAASPEVRDLRFLYDPSAPGGREQAGDISRLESMTSLGRDPVAVEWHFGEDRVRISGSGHRISVALNVTQNAVLESVFAAAGEILGLSAAEFAF